MAQFLQISQYFVIFFVCFLATTKGQTTAPSQPKVTLNNGGILIGSSLKSNHGRNFHGFLGIPFAKPPVGDLRFSAPEPADPWVGERMATKDAPACPQIDIFFNFLQYQGAEDCLYLNVYVPEKPKTKGPLPVMVWIFGGAYVYGNGMMSFYNPSLLMDRDIVLVSFNYRVGTLGFLSSETLDIPGNFGLKDQLLALKWVQEHISAFGGDPKNVTLFGESSGASSVMYLTNSPKAEGLFHKAIAQSGSLYNRWARPAAKGYAANISRKISEIVGCGDSTASWPTILKCLRTVSAQSLAEAINKFFVWRYLPSTILPIVVEPEHEQAFITETPVITKRSNSVPLMMGYNTDEGLLIYALRKVLPISEMSKVYQNVTSAFMNYERSPEKNYATIKSQIDEFYFKNGVTDYNNLTNALTDAWFLGGVDTLLRERVAASPNAAPTYFYNFDNKGFSITYFANTDYLGTCHFDDLFYLYPLNEVIIPTRPTTKSDVELREIFLDLWYNFACQGNPTPENSNLLKWPPVKSYPPTLMRIGSQTEGKPQLTLTSEYPTDRMNFWAQLGKYLSN